MQLEKSLWCAVACLHVGFALAAQSSPPVLLSGADLYTVSHGVIARGELLIHDGKIAALGDKVTAPADAERIDVTGRRIYPGLIASSSALGLMDINMVPATVDVAEAGENNAHLHTEVAVRPDTEHWPVARAGGVLTALIVPQVRDGGLFAGQSALLQPKGWTGRQMTLASGVAMHLYWPAKPDRLQRLDQIIEQARLYRVARRAGAIEIPDLPLQALTPVLEGTMPLAIHVKDTSQLQQALAFADRQQLRIVLVAGVEAVPVAAEIAARNVPVIFIGGPISSRGGAFEDVSAAPGKLAAAGVRIVIANPGGNAKSAVRLPAVAATYAAYGLGDEAALRAITLTPAEILGVGERLGSLDVGKAATLLVTEGDIFLPTKRVVAAWIDGRSVDLADNHHLRLYEKYQRKYRELTTAQ